jgi:predicted DNA-binding protein
MIAIDIPDQLSKKLYKMAESFGQTPEEYILELIEERIERDSAYRETDYLAKSAANRKRLNEAVRDIRAGKYEAHELIHEDD